MAATLFHPPAPAVRICFLGDSLVAGVGDPEHRGWVGRVAHRATVAGLDLTAYNLGVRAQTTDQVAARYAECVARLPRPAAGRIVISTGVNDTDLDGDLPRLTTMNSAAALTTLLQRAHADGYQAAVVGPTPAAEPAHRGRISSLSHSFADVAQRAGAPFVDVFTALEGDDTWLADLSDGVHPGPAGYTRLADLVWSGLGGWLARAPATVAAATVVTAIAERLSLHQERVRAALARIGPAAGGTITLTAASRRELIQLGHFPEYGGELAWTAHQVAGHLRDSARVFAERISLLRAGGEPVLPRFEPLEPDRIAGYDRLEWSELMDSLGRAQSALVQVILTCWAEHLAHAGRRANGSPITLQEVLEFLPGHQEDHAIQLERMAVPAA
ncbi:MAG TPA: GDSL-type esterase/lipase family protein [Micromonosporaceae bacterium]